MCRRRTARRCSSGGGRGPVGHAGLLGDHLPWAAGFVIVTTMVLLFLAFGSVLLPVKAVVMAALSLSAMFGVIVWVFQEGNLASWFNVTPTGTIEATQPVIMVAIAFGLSMDYEVFLLSRVREEWDRTHDNTRAVAVGCSAPDDHHQRCALLVVVIGAFATSGRQLYHHDRSRPGLRDPP